MSLNKIFKVKSFTFSEAFCTMLAMLIGNDYSDSILIALLVFTVVNILLQTVNHFIAKRVKD